MEGQYSIKVKFSSVEIEISGSDKDFVTKSFEATLEKLKTSTLPLSNNQSTIPLLAQNNPSPLSSGTPSLNGQGANKFAQDAGINYDDLLNIYDFKNNEVFIHKIISGKDSQKQQTIAKLALIAHEYITGKTELTGKALGVFMTELNAGDTSNLAANLKRGGILKVKSNYRLNAVARKDALELVKELSKV